MTETEKRNIRIIYEKGGSIKGLAILFGTTEEEIVDILNVRIQNKENN